jgi:hypothetical protein
MRQIDCSNTGAFGTVPFGQCALAILVAASTGLILGLILRPSHVSAADWTIDGQVQLEGQYDDNKQLDPDDEKDTFGSVLTPEFTILGRTERTELEINPRLSVGLFTEDSSFNYFDQYVNIGVTHQTQLGALGFDSTLSHESTLETEVNDTGDLSDKDGRRLGLQLGPFWTYSLSERDNITFRGRYEKVHYIDANNLEDFSLYGGSIGYERQLTLQDTVGADVSYGRFENDDDNDEKSDAFGAGVNWGRDFSERLSTGLSLGVRYVDSQGNNNDDQIGGTFSGRLNWEVDERTSLNASVSRGLEPSGAGNLTLRDRINLNLDFQAWQTVGFRLNSFYRRNSDSTSTGFSDETNQLASINPRVIWQLTRQWDLFAGYRFRWEEDGNSDNATSNTVQLGLTYQTPVWHIND